MRHERAHLFGENLSLDFFASVGKVVSANFARKAGDEGDWILRRTADIVVVYSFVEDILRVMDVAAYYPMSAAQAGVFNGSVSDMFLCLNVAFHGAFCPTADIVHDLA